MTQTVSVSLSWEEECKRRINMWHEELMDLARERNMEALQSLKVAVDAQLALAELKIKVRQADWAKVILWLSHILPTVGAVVGAYIGATLRHS